MEIELGWLLIRHRVLVANVDDNFFMEMDLIGKHGLVYDPEQQILKFGEAVKQVVNAVMDILLGSCVELIEPTRDSNKLEIVVRFLIKTSKMAPVCVANISLVETTTKKEIS